MASTDRSRPDHYRVLGVPRTATATEIRRAYHARARQFHPDRRQGGDEAMSSVNAAYEVLADPVRRAEYDRRTFGPTSTGTAGQTARPAAHPDPDVEAEMELRRTRSAASGPARIPWKAMAVTALIGCGVVLVASFFVDPPSEETPDGILRVGSCVELLPNNDVREIACTGDDDRIVELIVPLDARCPSGLVAHRDRLGLVKACLEATS